MANKFEAKVYPFPGSHFNELPKYVQDYLVTKYKFDPKNEMPEWMKEHSCLIVSYDGKVISCNFDGGQIEDQTLNRDRDWVSGVVQKAYEIGFEEGSLDAKLVVNSSVSLF